MYKLEVEPIQKFQTACCALATLSVGNNNSISEIKEAILRLKEESESRNFYTPGRQRIPYGEKSVFTIISPGEDGLDNPNRLEYKLVKCGFKFLTELPRRKGYPKGILKMYFLTFSD